MSSFNSTDNNIANVFSINNEFYYINNDGKLFKVSEDGDVFVYKFPTYLVHWSNIQEAIVFYDQNMIYLFDPTKLAFVQKIEVDLRCDRRDQCYVVLASKDCIFLRKNSETYKVQINTHQTEEVFFPIANQLYCNETYSVFQSADYKHIYAMDLGTNTVFEVNCDSTNLPVISACILNDQLYYVRSDGLLHFTDIGTNNGLKQLNTVKNIVAIAPYNNSLVCVVGKAKEDIIHTSVIFLNNGKVDVLADSDKPFYAVPGSCKIVISDNEFCYIITTDNNVRCGALLN